MVFFWYIYGLWYTYGMIYTLSMDNTEEMGFIYGFLWYMV